LLAIGTAPIILAPCGLLSVPEQEGAGDVMVTADFGAA
jgi:hypothetical protein